MFFREFISMGLQSFRRQHSLVEKLQFLVKRCKSIESLEQIHTQMLVNSIQLPLLNDLLSRIIELKDFGYSTRFFATVPVNSYAFNVMIRGFTTTWQRFDLALLYFAKMKHMNVKPDNFTFPFVFMSCGSLSEFRMGKSVHSEALRMGLLMDFHVAHSLITMYARCGQMGFARNVFDEMSVRDLVSWNSIISGYSKLGFAGEAVELFRGMKEEGFVPNEMTLVSVLAACGTLGNLSLGKQIEEHVNNTAMEVNSFIGSALINMYGKCGELESAKRIFNRMGSKDIISWNAMISGYAQNGQSEETIAMFKTMLEIGPEPNEITLIAILSASASLGALDMGKWIDDYATRRGIHNNIYVATALVDMYSKCGNLECASKVFENMPERNQVSWNAMITAHAVHGQAKKALALFQRMLDEEKHIHPDEITFVGVLSACVHGGLVDKGRDIFNQMSSSFGLTPKAEHYSCVVDLLCRNGLVNEAWDFVQLMPQKPDEILLGSLLSACQKVKNVEISEKASELLIELEPSNSGNYVISSKIYANLRMWDDCARMRVLMKQKGVSKTPGCSWIEMNGVLQEFVAGEMFVNDKIRRILSLLYDDIALEDTTVVEDSPYSDT